HSSHTLLPYPPLFPSFTPEEAWLSRYPSGDGSVHLEQFPDVPPGWRDEALAEKWRKVRLVRRVVTGAPGGPCAISRRAPHRASRSEEHTSELQSRGHL